MKRSIAAIVVLFLCIVAMAQLTPQEQYIRKWAPTAVREMYRSGVPASITLAQGILESRYGQSVLATEGNNHFGIKCHDWTGGKMYHDDDEKGECFRVYESAEQSFQDHSDFLRYRDRYKFLFEFDVTDYKAWAYGLKKAGYATDSSYPTKLIKYIEDYKLYEYDRMTEEEALALTGDDRLPEAEGQESVSSSSKRSGSTVSESGGKTKQKASRKERKKEKKKERKSAKKAKSAASEEHIAVPASPLSVEESRKLDNSSIAQVSFSLSRETYSCNGVPYIMSIEGETYSSIAKSYDLYLSEILKFNDLSAERELAPGTIVYLQAKKNQSESTLDKYIVGEDGESLWEICQRFGVKMSSVQKMNGFDAGYQPREGDTIVLRDKKSKKK